MKAIRVHNCGGPEVLTLDDLPIAEPKPGEARIKIEASGINFIDIYQRTGLYPLKTPFTLGMEGVRRRRRGRCGRHRSENRRSSRLRNDFRIVCGICHCAGGEAGAAAVKSG